MRCHRDLSSVVLAEETFNYAEPAGTNYRKSRDLGNALGIVSSSG
jgi:hypothetical protein